MKIGAILYINAQDSYEAVERYKEAFGLTLGDNWSYEDKAWGLTIEDDYQPYKGYFHAELMCDGVEVFAVSGEGGRLESGHNVQLALNLGSEEAVKKAFAILSEDAIYAGEISSPVWNPCVAELVDKYGIWWTFYI